MKPTKLLSYQTNSQLLPDGASSQGEAPFFLTYFDVHLHLDQNMNLLNYQITIPQPLRPHNSS